MPSTKLASGGEIHPDYIQHAQNSFLADTELEEFLQACGKPLRRSIRINSLKTTIEEFKQIAVSYNWGLTPIPWCKEGFWIDTSNGPQGLSLGNTPEHLQGLFYIQEASSMLPPVALINNLGVSQPIVVDMAAAPGSKTTQIAAMLNNKGIVLANELSASRLKGLHSNLVRCGIYNTCMSHLDARKIGELTPGQFDFVLLDAPCGGEGTVRKDINALKQWSLEKVNQLAKLQKELIMSAYAALKPGGRLVYSTCTLSPEENHQVADHLVTKTNARVVSLDQLFKGAEKVTTDKGYLHLLPHQFDSEGFFISCFSKPENSSEETSLIDIYTSPFSKINARLRQQLIDYYRKHYSIEIEPTGYELRQRDKEIWLFPRDISLISRYLKINRSGIKIAQVFPNKIRSTHEFACCFGDQASLQKVELSSIQLSQFVQGLNIEIAANLSGKGEVLLTYKKRVIGLGQNQNGKVKNGLPRELVKDNFKLLN